MSRSKLPLIIRREYVTRVRKVSFIVMSLLMPIGMILLMALPTIIAMIGTTDTSQVAVLDRTARYGQSLTSCKAVSYALLPPDTDEAALRGSYADSGYDAYLVIDGRPSERDSVRMYSVNTLPAEVKNHTEDDLQSALKKEIMNSYAAHTPELDSLFTSVNEATASVTTINLSDDGSESENFAEVGMIVSIIAAMLIYMFVLTTGSMVMQGVMEEKSNRIVEVLISSVKPFELMMGKILGIALVALTQLAIWIAFGVVIMSAASAFLSPEVAAAGAAGMGGMSDPAIAAATDAAAAPDIMARLASVNFIEIISLFVVYFLGGYLLYASLFAICGASMESPSDGNSLSLIVMIPLFAAIYIAIHTMQDPSSSLSFWASIFPFTSPIIMMARLPFGVPVWEIALSVAVLIGTFILSTWMAARIYRVGILMYGKKVTLKELVKWFRQD